MLTLTAEPVDVLPRPLFASEFAARLRAVSAAIAAALFAAVEPLVLKTVVPATACVDWVPLTAPPAVLTYSSFRTSGLCSHCGANSMITWYCWGLYGL